MSEGVRKESSQEFAERLSRMSVEELADYFDNHSTADMPFEPAPEVEIERPELEQVSLRMPAPDLAELRGRASRERRVYLQVGHGLLNHPGSYPSFPMIGADPCPLYQHTSSSPSGNSSVSCSRREQ